MLKLFIFILFALIPLNSMAYIIYSPHGQQDQQVSNKIDGAFGYKLGNKIQQEDVISRHKLNEFYQLIEVNPKEPIENIKQYNVIINYKDIIVGIYGSHKYNNLNDCQKTFKTYLTILQTKYKYLKEDKSNRSFYTGGNSEKWLSIGCSNNNDNSYTFIISYRMASDTFV